MVEPDLNLLFQDPASVNARCVIAIAGWWFLVTDASQRNFPYRV